MSTEGSGDAASGTTDSAGADRQTFDDSTADANRSEQEAQARPDSFDIGRLLGTDARGRTSNLQLLSPSELEGSGTSEAAGRLTSAAGDYFADRSNLKLLSTGEGPLGTALRPSSANFSPKLAGPERDAVFSYVSGQGTTKPNEGRAEIFFGSVGKGVANATGAFITGGLGKVADVSTTALAGISGAGFSMLGQLIEAPGREAGEALGRWMDPKIEQYKTREGYDSRIDPRYNPLGWPSD